MEIRVNPLYLSNTRVEELEQSLVLIYTGIKRRAADIEESKMKRLPQNLGALAEMRKMAEKGAGILQSHVCLDVFGQLLHDGWMAKRSLDPSVSNKDIDGIYQRGIDAGAWGGKLLGAGGGGFLLFAAPPERRLAIQAAFPEQPALPFGIKAPGVGVIFAS
jgi:D-glycero-alpha-D-manno-heptose-7-phosphate kinase